MVSSPFGVSFHLAHLPDKGVETVLEYGPSLPVISAGEQIESGLCKQSQGMCRISPVDYLSPFR
jgi:hypothetical protein